MAVFELRNALSRAVRRFWTGLRRRLGKANVATQQQVFATRSLLIGSLPLPSDFPVAEFESAELHFRARTGTSPTGPAQTWQEFSAAWMAVAYRLSDVAFFDSEFRDSLSLFGGAPPAPERYQQERLLFDFFVSGLSAIESLCYGLCAMAWEAEPQKVSLASVGQKRGVSPESTRDRFRAHFSLDAITSTLDGVVKSVEYAEWVDVRNALAHRTSPARKHYVNLGSAASASPPSEWGAMTLDSQLTAKRRAWLRGVLANLLADAGIFASAHF